MRSSAIPSFSIFITFVDAFQPNGFALWYWQSSIVVKNWLYITGGDNYTLTDGKATGGGVDVSYSIDLSQSWSTSTVEAQSFDNPSYLISIKKPMLWYDPHDGNVHQWGGLPWDVTQWPGSYYLIPTDQGTISWYSQAIPVSNGQTLYGPSAASSAYSEESFYFFGGSVQPNKTEYAVPGLVSNDFLTSNWTNSTETAGTIEEFVVHGEMQLASDFGEDGVLLVLGGEDPSTQMYTAGPRYLRDMSTIKIYDIKTQTWYSQNTTGTPSPDVTSFCTVGSKSHDNSSFDIFVFGGGTNATFDEAHPTSTDYQDVYILSLPAFTWFRANNPSSVRRTNHACQVIGNRQMLVIGGLPPSSPSGIQVDPFPNGLGIFDMTALSWTNGNYNASAEAYEQPAIVKQYYSQSYVKPTWSHPALATIFGLQNTTTSPNTPPSPSPPSPSPPPSPPPPPIPGKTNHTGAIVGGVIGGIAALVLICVCAFLLRKRRNKKRASALPSDEQKPPVEADTGGSHSSSSKQYHGAPVPVPELHGTHVQELGGQYYDAGGQVRQQHDMAELP